MSDEVKVDVTARLMAAWLHGITNQQQLIKALLEMKNLNPSIRSWIEDEHGEPDFHVLKRKDFEEFKKQADMLGVEYQVLNGNNGLVYIVTRGPVYEINEFGDYAFENGSRVIKNDDLGRPISGDRDKMDRILSNIHHMEIAQETGVQDIEDINNILTAEEAANRFKDKNTVIIDNMSYTEATLLQNRANDRGIDSYMRYDMGTNRYSVEISSFEFMRNSNYPDKMSGGEQLLLDYTAACSMPQVAERMEHMDQMRTEIVNYMIDVQNEDVDDNVGEKYLVDINNPSRVVSINEYEACIFNAGVSDREDGMDYLILNLRNKEDRDLLNLVVSEIGYDNLEILSRQDYDMYHLNFDYNDRSKNIFQHEQDIYNTALKVAYEVDKELIDKKMLNIEIRNFTPNEKEQLGKTPENDDHLQMITERIPGSDIILQDEVSRTTRMKYPDVSVINFAEKFKTKFAEIEVCEAMEHVQTQYYTARDHAEYVLDTSRDKADTLENPEQMYIIGTLEKNPAYVEKFNENREPEIGYETTAGAFEQDFIDRNMNGIDDRIEGFLDYDGDHRDDRVEGEYDSDEYATLAAPGFDQEYDPSDYSTEWDSEIEPEHELGDFWND